MFVSPRPGVWRVAIWQVWFVFVGEAMISKAFEGRISDFEVRMVESTRGPGVEPC